MIASRPRRPSGRRRRHRYARRVDRHDPELGRRRSGSRRRLRRSRRVRPAIGPWTRRRARRRRRSRSIRAAPPRTFSAFLILADRRRGAPGAPERRARPRRSRGRRRVAVVLFVLGLRGWAFEAHHLPDYPVEQNRSSRPSPALFRPASSGSPTSGSSPGSAGTGRPPHRLDPAAVGGVRDPLVGRDLLVGVAFGVGRRSFPASCDAGGCVDDGGVPYPEFNGVWADEPRYVGRHASRRGVELADQRPVAVLLLRRAAAPAAPAAAGGGAASGAARLRDRRRGRLSTAATSGSC